MTDHPSLETLLPWIVTLRGPCGEARATLAAFQTLADASDYARLTANGGDFRSGFALVVSRLNREIRRSYRVCNKKRVVS